jgi:pilus assembly protein TadC
MDTTTESKQSSRPHDSKPTFTEQAAAVLRNAIDYASSSIRLIQAEAASLALSSVTFLVLVLLTVLTGFVAFALLSVALGIWLAHVTGGAGWALVIMGGFYSILAVVAGAVAFRWLARLRA